MKKCCCSVIWLFAFGVVGVLPVPQQMYRWYQQPNFSRLSTPNCTSTHPYLPEDACDFWKLEEKLFERYKWDSCECSQYAAYISSNEPPNEASAIKLQRLLDHFFYNVRCNLNIHDNSKDQTMTNSMEFSPKLTIAIIETFIRNCQKIEHQDVYKLAGYRSEYCANEIVDKSVRKILNKHSPRQKLQ